MTKRDKEYHEARALLLGRWYSPLTHCYIKEERGRDDRIDADTLELVSDREATKRIDDAYLVR